MTFHQQPEPFDDRVPLRRGRRVDVPCLVVASFCLLAAAVSIWVSCRNFDATVRMFVASPDAPPTNDPYWQRQAFAVKLFAGSCCGSIVLVPVGLIFFVAALQGLTVNASRADRR